MHHMISNIMICVTLNQLSNGIGHLAPNENLAFEYQGEQHYTQC